MPSIPWSPILDSIEDPVGVWTLKHGEDGEVTKTAYGTVTIGMNDGHPGYRAALLDGTDVGFYRTLLRACRAVWEADMEDSARRRRQAVFTQAHGHAAERPTTR